MTTTRRWVAAGLGALLVVGPLVRYLLLPVAPAPEPGVTLENFRRLRVDGDRLVTEKEVEALFGVPGNRWGRVTGSHYTAWEEGTVSVSLRFSDVGVERDGTVVRGWLEMGSYIDGATGHIEKVPSGREPQRTFLGKLKGWLAQVLP